MQRRSLPPHLCHYHYHHPSFVFQRAEVSEVWELQFQGQRVDGTIFLHLWAARWETVCTAVGVGGSVVGERHQQIKIECFRKEKLKILRNHTNI